MGRRILVVDDERVIADTLCAILRNQGYDAIAFYDAESALIASSEEDPEFVISDVVMPGMSGVDMAVQIRGRWPGCGILLFSGQAGTVDILEAAHRQGYDFDFLTKPVHPKDLLAKLKSGVRHEADGLADIDRQDSAHGSLHQSRSSTPPLAL
jgi:DNA-binding response OmpR family regulator